MARLQWDTKDQPKYQSGVSQGVFYNENGEGIPWSGLVSVAEKPQANAPTPIYSSTGVKYQHHGNKAEKKSGVSCYMYPEEMDEYLGYEVLDDYGYLADERPPKPFHMAYRVERGNDHYEIHVLLNQIATFNETSYQTISDAPALSTIALNLEGVPDPKFGTSHLVLDSRLPITKSAEALLFGSDYSDANILTFINAEPVWEDVAINYAPVVEPDYDNMVWLGRNNVCYAPSAVGKPSNGWTVSPGSYRDISFSYTKTDTSNYYTCLFNNLNTVVLSAGSSITCSYLSKIETDVDVNVQDLCWFSAGLGDTKPKSVPMGDGWFYNTFTRTVDKETTCGIGMNFVLHRPTLEKYPEMSLTGRIKDFKIEIGPYATPWVPSAIDPIQGIPENKPRPSNYVPGVKKITKGNVNPGNAIAFYDEINKALGIYNKSLTETATCTLRFNDYPVGSEVNFKAIGYQTLRDGYSESYAALRIAMGFPAKRSWGDMIQNSQGMETGSVELTTDRTIHLANGQYSGIADTSYRDLMITLPTYKGPFFDANTPVKERGNRYLRVERPGYDYTIHQQLRLRSLSSVLITDVTPWWYTLQSSDTQLSEANGVFTFSGPQAEVYDDGTFTIDDSVYSATTQEG